MCTVMKRLSACRPSIREFRLQKRTFLSDMPQQERGCLNSFQPTPFLHENSLLRKNSNEQVKKSRSKQRKTGNSLEYPNKKCTFANRVVRRSKSQNISALALSLNRYYKSATPPFYSDIQSDASFLIILCKDNANHGNNKMFGQLFSSFSEAIYIKQVGWHKKMGIPDAEQQRIFAKSTWQIIDEMERF